MASVMEQYCNKIMSGEIPSCRKLKQVCQRILNDLYNPGEWHFDEELANRHVEFIETFCCIPSGQLGKPFKLEEFQKAQLQAIFGFVDDNNIRKYNEALIIEGRKNGKTSLLAAILLDMLVNDGEGSPQCVTAATKLDQAKLSYDAACKMRALSPFLTKHIKKRQSDLYFPLNMGTIKPMANNTKSLDGLDIHCCVIDELSAIKTRDTYDLLKQAMGARSQPLLFCITTNGYVREGIFDAQYNYAKRVLDGEIDNPRFIAFIYEAESADEIQNEDLWMKANPGLGVIKSKEYLREMVAKANVDETFRPTVLTKDFNLPQSGNNTWLDFNAVLNETVVSMDFLRDSYAIGGCDLSATTDLSCATILIRKANDPKSYVLQHYWLPRARIDYLKNTQSHEAPYELWAEQGWITITEGNVVDYHDITRWFYEMFTEYEIRPLWVGYDRWSASFWANEMTEYGFEMEKVPQTPLTWTYPMKQLKAEFEAHNIVYQNNPITRWCLSNTGLKVGNQENSVTTWQPVKIAQNRRIDGTVSLLNTFVELFNHKEDYEAFIQRS